MTLMKTLTMTLAQIEFQQQPHYLITKFLLGYKKEILQLTRLWMSIHNSLYRGRLLFKTQEDSLDSHIACKLARQIRCNKWIYFLKLIPRYSVINYSNNAIHTMIRISIQLDQGKTMILNGSAKAKVPSKAIKQANLPSSHQLYISRVWWGLLLILKTSTTFTKTSLPSNSTPNR